MQKKPFLSKLSLIIFGLLLGLLLLEGGLRFAGFLVNLPNQLHIYRERHTAKDLTILCIGESTTHGQWPIYLQECFAAYKPELRVRVVDKGLGGTTTAAVASRLPRSMKEYSPDIVISMLGINDEDDTQYYDDSLIFSMKLMLKNIRVYKLGKLILEHVHNAFNEVVFAEGALKIEEKTVSSILKRYTEYEEYSEAIAALDTVRKAASESCLSYDLLGKAYEQYGEFFKAKDCYEHALELEPSVGRYVKTGLLMIRLGATRQALALLEQAQHAYPNESDIYWALAENHLLLSDHEKVKSYYLKALVLEPSHIPSLTGIVRLYVKFDYREELHRLIQDMGIDGLPFASQRKIAQYYFYHGRYTESIEMYEKILATGAHNFDLYSGLAMNYEGLKQYSRARYYREKAKTIRLKEYLPATKYNYTRIKDIVDSYGAQLVCVQYPMRDSDALEKIFEDRQGIIFVENRERFHKAVEEKGYHQYFIDSFASDFGHCTNEGNKLIAETIVSKLMKEYF